MKPCAVCGQPAAGRCHREGCDETVHSKCMTAHTPSCRAPRGKGGRRPGQKVAMVLKTLNDGNPLPKFTKQQRRYECIVCHKVISRGSGGVCIDCGAHVHSGRCAVDHAKHSSALHVRDVLSASVRTYEREVMQQPPVGLADEQFAEALALPVAEHDAVLDLLGGDWPEAWPVDDPLLAGLRLGDQFRAAEARRR